MKSRKGKKKAANRGWKRYWWLWSAIAAVVAVLIYGMVWYMRECRAQYDGDEVRIYVPRGASEAAIADTLSHNLGESFGGRVYRIWRWRDGLAGTAEGSYVVRPGMSVVDVSRKLLTGAQDPVKVTFNNVRTMPQLAQRVSRRMEMQPEEFLAACSEVLDSKGYTKENYPAAFLPDTYEFYWNAAPDYVVKRLVDVREKFWTKERLQKAQDLGLTPEEVAVVASIVEEETAKADERPMVARLYLNRLKKHMKLQADPTVKFAYGDFSLRRITGKHLQTKSPYNTYLNEGLPPGPIRVVERQTLDDVLNAPMNPYIYMCAKEDFSGYHNFAVNDAEHMANARRYHQALNRRGIK